MLRRQLGDASWARTRRLIETGKVFLDGRAVLDPAALVPATAALHVRMAAPRPQAPAALGRDAIVFADVHVVVVKKPAGISTVPFEPGEKGTLEELVRGLLVSRGDPRRADAPLGIVHRIDRETSGLVVFARTLDAKRALGLQFRAHSVHRRYLALAAGSVSDGTLRSRLVRDRGDGRRGSTRHPRLGQLSITHVRVLERLPGATLVECRLETSRTHQIRIQLAETGHPLLGEPVYVPRDFPPLPPAPRLMLHAAELGFVHPTTGRALHFEDPLPDDLRGVLQRLRDAAR